jgi:hypothetical protein
MSVKLISIAVPFDWQVPEIINTLAPEENALILSMGTNIIRDARNVVAGLSQKEIYKKIQEESKEEIQKLELNLLVQKELNNNLDQSLRGIYESQIDQLKNQIDQLKTKIYNYENQNKELLKTEIEKEREKFRFLLEEKEKQVNKINETHELILKQTHKSTSSKGQEGEKVFEYYSEETFKDFKGYNLIDKHTQGGSGDFHLQFEEFDVLVDAKNYKKKVPIEQRDKIKKDLIKNEHISFAWLVSLNTSIDKFDKAPVMYEWINTKQCIVYINNLTESEDPRKILRIVWFTCKELFKFVEENSVDNEELQDLKNNKFKLMDKIRNMRKTMREINTTMNTTRNMLQLLDEEFKEILNTETEKIVESNYSMFDDWWEKNIELTNGDEKILSTDLWFKFKQDNKSAMKEFDVTTEKFKQFIKAKVPMTSILLKSKNANSAFEIKGITWKNIKKEIEVPKLEVVLVEQTNKVKKGKEKDPEVYFDSKKDKTIIEDYKVSSTDVMSLAKKYNVKTFQIVSLLVRYKLISKRSEARGYEKYKETEEYKNKL